MLAIVCVESMESQISRTVLQMIVLLCLPGQNKNQVYKNINHVMHFIQVWSNIAKYRRWTMVLIEWPKGKRSKIPLKFYRLSRYYHHCNLEPVRNNHKKAYIFEKVLILAFY